MRSAFASVVVIGLAACSSDDGAADVAREQVALVPAVPRRDVDLLFVLDDSTSVLHLHQSLKDAFPNFLNALNVGGLPNLHIGVVTSDLGTQGANESQPGPPIGSGPGSCSGTGRNGALQTNGTTLVTGSFISDTANGDGTRSVNYTGSLANAFSAIASVGSSGCGFEQPLEAMRRALDNHPSNAGFLRVDAALAIVLLQDEDDCSFQTAALLGADTTMLGPLQSFRCTRFGVVCDVGGADAAAMNTLGMKSECHWNESSGLLTPRSRYETFLDTVKADRRDVLLTAIAAGETSLTVEARTPPGGGSAIPAVAHACTWDIGSGPAAADPAVRVADLVGHVARGRMATVCTADYTQTMLTLAQDIRGMLGDTCLTRDIALPADCLVADQTLSGETSIPPCSAQQTTDCYQLVEDAACTTSQKLRVVVTRSSPASADTMVSMRCRI